MKNLLLMEIYSIIYMQCTTTKIPHTFTRVEALRFDEGRQRHIIKCESKRFNWTFAHSFLITMFLFEF